MKFKNIKISNVMDVKTGLPLRQAAKGDRGGDALLIQMKNVNPVAGINWEKVIRISTEGYRNPDWLQKDDVLFVGRGSRFFAVKVSDVSDKTVASPHFYVLRDNGDRKILPEFLVWYLNSQMAKKFYAANQKGSALPFISRKALSALPVILPDLATQEKIVNIYQCWQKQRQLLAELEDQKDVYINALLEQTLKGENA